MLHGIQFRGFSNRLCHISRCAIGRGQRRRILGGSEQEETFGVRAQAQALPRLQNDRRWLDKVAGEGYRVNRYYFTGPADVRGRGRGPKGGHFLVLAFWRYWSKSGTFANTGKGNQALIPCVALITRLLHAIKFTSFQGGCNFTALGNLCPFAQVHATWQGGTHDVHTFEAVVCPGSAVSTTQWWKRK